MNETYRGTVGTLELKDWIDFISIVRATNNAEDSKWDSAVEALGDLWQIDGHACDLLEMKHPERITAAYREDKRVYDGLWAVTEEVRKLPKRFRKGDNGDLGKLKFVHDDLLPEVLADLLYHDRVFGYEHDDFGLSEFIRWGSLAERMEKDGRIRSILIPTRHGSERYWVTAI